MCRKKQIELQQRENGCLLSGVKPVSVSGRSFRRKRHCSVSGRLTIGLGHQVHNEGSQTVTAWNGSAWLPGVMWDCNLNSVRTPSFLFSYFFSLTASRSENCAILGFHARMWPFDSRTALVSVTYLNLSTESETMYSARGLQGTLQWLIADTASRRLAVQPTVCWTRDTKPGKDLGQKETPFVRQCTLSAVCGWVLLWRECDVSPRRAPKCQHLAQSDLQVFSNWIQKALGEINGVLLDVPNFVTAQDMPRNAISEAVQRWTVPPRAPQDTVHFWRKGRLQMLSV